MPSSPEFRRFARAVSAVAGLVLAGGAALWAWGEHVSPAYPEVRSRAAAFAASASTLTAATFGNSHNQAISFEHLGLDGFHLWEGGRDVFETARSFEEALPRMPRLVFAFVAVSPFAYDNALLDELEPGRANRRRQVYVEYDTYWPVRRDWKQALRARLAPVARPDNWNDVVDAVRRGSPSTPASSPQSERGSMTRAEARSQAAERVDRHVTMERESFGLDDALCRDAHRALDAMAEAASDTDTEVVLFTPPYISAYSALIRARGDHCRLGRHAERLAQRWTHVRYLDYSSAPPFSDSLAYFYDPDHMSRIGAAAFSDTLRAVLRTSGGR